MRSTRVPQTPSPPAEQNGKTAHLGESSPAPEPQIPTSRAGRSWVALIPGALILLLVVVFVAQNPQRGQVNFLVLSGDFPLGIALLASAALGGLAVFALGSVRILQLRRAARRPVTR